MAVLPGRLKAPGEGELMSEYTTVFGSLDNYEKGRVVIVDDDPKAYVFSNVFEVAHMSKPYEKVAVGKNLEYVLEAIRCEGTSEWRAAAHDEFALVMDGTVVIELLDPDEPQIDPSAQGSIGLAGEPAGKRMGKVTATQGHMTMLPAGKCYRFNCEGLGVILLQTIEGADTLYRWADICQTD